MPAAASVVEPLAVICSECSGAIDFNYGCVDWFLYDKKV
jgi:hypothetical protein